MYVQLHMWVFNVHMIAPPVRYPQAHGISVTGMNSSVLGSVGRWLDRGISRLMGTEGLPPVNDGSLSDEERRPKKGPSSVASDGPRVRLNPCLRHGGF